MKLFLSYLKPYRLKCILAPLFKLLEAILELFVPIVMAKIIDEGIAYKDNGYIFTMAAVLVGIAAVGLIVSITAQYFAAGAAVGMARDLSTSLFKHICGISMTDYDKQGASTLITRTSSDINTVQSGVNLSLRLLLRSPFIVLGAAVMSFTIDVRSALTFVVIIPMLAVTVAAIMYVSIPLYKNVQTSLEKVSLRTRENLSGVRPIRAFIRQSSEIKSFKEETDKLKNNNLTNSRIQSLLSPATFIIVNIGIIILIRTGSMKVYYGQLTQGQVVALINYMSQILVELVKLANLIISINKALACWGRIEDVLKMPADIRLTEDVYSAVSTVDDDTLINFDNVDFRYPGSSESTVCGFNLNIKSGQKIGVIGGTGAGKSTLIKLILGYYPVSEGKISRNIDASEISIVPQRSTLFTGTVRDNLLMGRTGIDDDTLVKSLKAALAYEFVESKGGLDAEVEKDGRNFSGGQRQRLAIARALCGHPKLLILDDSFSALDTVTERAIESALDSYADIAKLIISQRISPIRNADEIIVLEDGVVMGAGKHSDLVNSCDVYLEIAKIGGAL